ncbi:unnamed protein product [Mycena citricolor]|uniref:Uncharacterized protein n=1 Tax=Mycena citricolor TaxID=2018698 RepID=A0AAD2H8H4_9AGAR|nr:unnamed protein product [Mycena citricolor]CAK5271994.1 unnamed protein product [Mycena citricolor]
MSGDPSLTNASLPVPAALGHDLSKFGRDLNQDAVGVIWESMFVGAYGVFFMLAVYSIFRKGMRSRGSYIMLAVVIYLYATSLTLWALNVTSLFQTTRALLMIEDQTASVNDRINLANEKLMVLGNPMEALFMFNMVVGDAVVIWRAWVLYHGRWWIVGMPCLMLLLSLGFNITDIVCLTHAGFSTNTSIAGVGDICPHAELMSWAFSLGTNFICTVLIATKAWTHRRSTRNLHSTASSGNRPRRTLSTDKVLALLVESGFIYCLFWLTQLILFFDIPRSSPAIYVYELFAGMGDQISGLYPTLIIVIVNFHRTIWDSDDGASRNRASTQSATGFSTIRWAPNTPHLLSPETSPAPDTAVFDTKTGGTRTPMEMDTFRGKYAESRDGSVV